MGLPLLVALPGIWRAIRRFEADGDRFMLLWLVAILIAMYLPTNVQRRFAVGLMLPLAYFAARALEDYWLPRLNRHWRYRLFAIIAPVMMFSNLFVLFTPILPVLINQPQNASGLFLWRDYLPAFDWIRIETEPTDVILAAPQVGTWLPGWAEATVVYGHPYETIDADAKREAVIDWYEGVGCEDLLEAYDIAYVVYGPEEREIGEGACLNGLSLVARIGRIEIYAP
jgi:hypothetical protein